MHCLVSYLICGIHTALGQISSQRVVALVLLHNGDEGALKLPVVTVKTAFTPLHRLLWAKASTKTIKATLVGVNSALAFSFMLLSFTGATTKSTFYQPQMCCLIDTSLS